MAIFQKSVTKKHLNNLDKEQVEKAYLKFKSNYNTSKIEQIKTLKEEEYQDGFLRDIFVDVFGYTLRPDENYNLQREFKNQSDGKKADGAIIDNNGFNPIALAVIELKSTKTKDLTKVTQQAFNYKNNQPECKYVITSNFQKLRFYIDYANEYEEFDLFYLEKEDFELLYLLLNKNSIFDNLPLKLKEETKFHEQEVSSKLYKDYSYFKKNLYQNLTKNHPESDKLTLFKKSQKLLDRFLFILFAEDSGLLPPNSISRVIETYRKLIDLDAKKPLYAIFKQYFGYMNIGRKGKTNSDDIPAYNGGLFYTDDLLDSLKIDDNILIDDLLNLSEYDFDTEIDVNILGHIFEHSLSEIEEVTAEIEGTRGVTRDLSPLKISKRKKDGVFYTPKYITQYIVENTIGTLCNEKRIALNIEEIEFDGSFRTKAGKLSEKGKKLYSRLKEYKDWLISLKIIDPACGSGAFLNQALNFLIEEHTIIDDVIAELTNTPLRLFDIDKSILENNLFGVDINEESVEIARLSLWLRTAQKGRKLSNLNNNIKCGNSLIDDPEIAGDKAFNWQTEFPQIFKEKNKKAYHITTAIHDSRTSARMLKYKVRENREMGTNPYPNIIYFTKEDDLLITQTIAEIVKENRLNLLAYNICADHIHLLLVCDIDEVASIMQQIKGRTSYVHKGYYKGLKPLAEGEEKEENNKPLWQQKYSAPKEITTEVQLQNTLNYIQKNRNKHELPEHSSEIKLLIENMCVDFDTAMQPEYNGGFDCVIGNPPYLRVQGLRENFEKESQFYERIFESATGRFDIYVLFMEKSYQLIKQDGIVSFILPHKFLISDFGEGIRNFFAKNKAVSNLVHFGSEMVFDDASTYTCIINLTHNDSDLKFKQIKPSELFDLIPFDVANYNSLSGEKWNLKNENTDKLFKKIHKQPWNVKDVFENISQGVVSVGDDIFLMQGEIKGDKFVGFSDKIKDTVTLEASIVKPLLKGEDVKKYAPLDNTYFCLYPHFEKDGKTIPFDEDYFKEKFPLAYNYMLPFKEELIEKKIRYKTNPTAWYSLHRSREISLFEQEKIITPEISLGTNMTLDLNNKYHNTKCYTLAKKDSVIENNKYWLAILNSKLLWFFLQSTGYVLRGGFFTFKTKYLEPFPLPKLENIDLQNPFIEKVDIALINTKVFTQIKNKFQTYLQSQFSIEKLTKKLQNWYELDFSEFIKELNKVIKKVGGEKLTKTDEMDWMDVFETKKAEAQTLKTKINKIDKEIDQMVYELYGLSEEDIKIIEGC